MGIGLLVAALALAAAALVLWQNGTTDAEHEQQARRYAEAISRQALDDAEPNRTGPIALGAVSGVLFLGGVIVLVSPSRDS